MVEEINEIDLAMKSANIAQKEYDAEKRLQTKTKQILPEYKKLKSDLLFLQSQARATKWLLRELVRKDETERLKALRLFKDEKWEQFRKIVEKSNEEARKKELKQ